MFTSLHGTSYIANPLDREAVQVVRTLGGCANTWIATSIANTTAALSGILGIVFLVRGISIPEEWYQSVGENDWIGIGLFCLCLIIGAGAWKLIHMGDESYQWKKLRQLVSEGRTLSVPTRLEVALNYRLDAANMRQFAEEGYPLTIRDYEILREVGSAEHRGVTTTPGFNEQHVDPLLDSFVARIQVSYEDTQAVARGRLEALRDEPPLIEG